MPHCCRARLDPPRGVTFRTSSSSLMSTSSVAVKLRTPFGPFTSTVWPETVALPSGVSATDRLPIRDITASSEHGAQDLAADVVGAGLGVGHDAPRGRHDGDAETLTDLRQFLDAGIDPTAGLRHPLDLADHRGAVVVLQRDLEVLVAVGVLDGLVASDETFGLQDLEDALAHLRGGGADGRLAAHAGVADAGQHVAERIVHEHGPLLTSSTSPCRGSGRRRPGPAARCATCGACDSKPADGPTPRSGCASGTATNSAAVSRASWRASRGPKGWLPDPAASP